MELMVVIVIVAILAAVAVPLYVNYVRDAQRTEAKGAIGAVITAEQTYYQLNGTYVLEKFKANPQSASPPQVLNCDLTDALTNWTIEVTVAGSNGFTVLATGKNGTPAFGRSVQLQYTRTSQPIWTEN
jgi:type IV pilus assembly protein PilE